MNARNGRTNEQEREELKVELRQRVVVYFSLLFFSHGVVGWGVARGRSIVRCVELKTVRDVVYFNSLWWVNGARPADPVQVQQAGGRGIRASGQNAHSVQ